MATQSHIAYYACATFAGCLFLSALFMNIGVSDAEAQLSCHPYLKSRHDDDRTLLTTLWRTGDEATGKPYDEAEFIVGSARRLRSIIDALPKRKSPGTDASKKKLLQFVALTTSAEEVFHASRITAKRSFAALSLSMLHVGSDDTETVMSALSHINQELVNVNGWTTVVFVDDSWSGTMTFPIVRTNSSNFDSRALYISPLGETYSKAAGVEAGASNSNSQCISSLPFIHLHARYRRLPLLSDVYGNNGAVTGMRIPKQLSLGCIGELFIYLGIALRSPIYPVELTDIGVKCGEHSSAHTTSCDLEAIGQPGRGEIDFDASFFNVFSRFVEHAQYVGAPFAVSSDMNSLVSRSCQTQGQVQNHVKWDGPTNLTEACHAFGFKPPVSQYSNGLLSKCKDQLSQEVSAKESCAGKLEKLEDEDVPLRVARLRMLLESISETVTGHTNSAREGGKSVTVLRPSELQSLLEHRKLRDDRAGTSEQSAFTNGAAMEEESSGGPSVMVIWVFVNLMLVLLWISIFNRGCLRLRNQKFTS